MYALLLMTQRMEVLALRNAETVMTSLWEILAMMETLEITTVAQVHVQSKLDLNALLENTMKKTSAMKSAEIN
jgi:hypothetical protein